MTSQGWSEGQALGARDDSSSSSPSSSSATKRRHHHSGLATDAQRLAATRVGILFKDDNLGLGAKRKGGAGRDVEGQRTGLDAFQGLLGRLNGKEEGELKEMERKGEERRLEMFFRGRWGGMVFVRGGVLVGSERGKEGGGEREGEQKQEVDDEEETKAPSTDQAAKNSAREERRRLKEENRLRKEQRRKRREAKSLKKAAKQPKSKPQPDTQSDSNSNSDAETPSHAQPTTTLPTPNLTPSHPPDEPLLSSPSSPSPSENPSPSESNKKKRKSAVSTLVQAGTETSRSSSPSSNNVAALRNGRHLLRGRNIQAKRMVLADAKGLDQIFMR